MKSLVRVVLVLSLSATLAAQSQVERVVETLELSPGQTVADVGAGSGRYSRPLARAVAPGGVVYAVDIDQGALDRNQRAAKDEGLTNITPVLAEASDAKIPEPVDVIFFSDSLHHVPDPPAYVKHVRRYLKPGGRIVVLDFSRNWPGAHHIRRYTADELDAWMSDAGLQRVASHDFVADRFFVVYR